MWDRRILKSNAKIALRGRYWLIFAVTLLSGIISSGLTGIFNFITKVMTFFTNPLDFIRIIFTLHEIPRAVFLPNALIFIFIALPIEVGVARFFVQNHFGVTEFETMFSSFKREYLNTVGAMFVTSIITCLWALLLIVPGIIKGLQYSMVSYILADNPIILGSRAREISRIMTYNELGSIFVLYLSFIGWFALGLLTFGISNYFIMPYFQATRAELYIFLRDRAIQTNQVRPEEFGLFPQENPEPQHE